MDREENTVKDFETGLKELEQIVNQLEQDELPLEEALAKFEKGIRLSRSCTQCLEVAERRIEELTRDEQGQPLFKPREGQGTEE